MVFRSGWPRSTRRSWCSCSKRRAWNWSRPPSHPGGETATAAMRVSICVAWHVTFHAGGLPLLSATWAVGALQAGLRKTIRCAVYQTRKAGSDQIYTKEAQQRCLFFVAARCYPGIRREMAQPGFCLSRGQKSPIIGGQGRVVDDSSLSFSVPGSMLYRGRQ